MSDIAPATSSEPVIVPAPRTVDATENRWRHFRSVMTHTHTYSGKADHGGTVRPPRSYTMLAQWAAKLGIDAVGMGSPYTPASAGTYRKYDQQATAEYHRPDFDRKSVRDDDEIAQMLEQANALSRGRTLFYLDNETPKGRYGHLWWVGYDLDYPAWHDYDQPFDRWMCHTAEPGDDGDEPMAYERRPYRQIVALQRKAGALGFWAHPTSWWRDDEGRFITNIASEMPAHAIADGYVDGMVIMGYRSWRPEYMNVWFMLLDAGFRVTGVAEMDSGLSSEGLWRLPRAMTNHVHIPEPLKVPAMVKGFASGRLVAGNGPLIDLIVDGQLMGATARTSSKAQHEVTVHIDPQGATGQLDLVGRGGRSLWQQKVEGPAVVSLKLPGLDDRGYLIARFVANPHERHGPAAVSNPVYLHPEGRDFEKPAVTELALTVDSDSPFRGGRIQFEQADGQAIESGGLSDGVIKRTLPASGRFTLTTPDGEAVTEYLINANEPLTDVQRYLYRGRFLRDYPTAVSGEVPVEAWRLDEYAKAMRQLTLTR